MFSLPSPLPSLDKLSCDYHCPWMLVDISSFLAVEETVEWFFSLSRFHGSSLSPWRFYISFTFFGVHFIHFSGFFVCVLPSSVNSYFLLFFFFSLSFFPYLVLQFPVILHLSALEWIIDRRWSWKVGILIPVFWFVCFGDVLHEQHWSLIERNNIKYEVVLTINERYILFFLVI